MCEWTTHTKNISKSDNAIIVETEKTVNPIVENNVLVSGTTR